MPRYALVFSTLLFSIFACSSEAIDPSPSEPESLGVSQQALCSDDSQCNDSDFCTTDVCLALACVHLPVLGCCNTDNECDDANACLLGQCLLHTCGLAFNLGCNTDNANCGAEGYVCKGGRDCEDGACTPAWQPISTEGAPSGRYAASAAAFDGQYILTGGCTETTEDDASTEAYAYDPSNDSWTTLAPMSYGRAWHSSVTVESGTTVYGGLAVCNSTASVGLDFEKLGDMEDTSWSFIARNWDPSYNVAMARLDTDDVFMLGGSLTTYLYTEVREGSPASFGSWSDQMCFSGSPWVNLANGADYGRKNAIPIPDFDEEDRPIVWVLGGDPSVGDPHAHGLKFDIWSHQWTDFDSADDFPDNSDVMHSTATSSLSSVPVGPRFADDGKRVYVADNDGSMHIYNKETATWTVDSSSRPSGYCPEGAMAWVDGVLISFGGVCDGTISSVGVSYQPPAE